MLKHISLAIAIFSFLAIPVSMTQPSAASGEEIGEGFDKQSSDEIKAAHEKIDSLFKNVVHIQGLSDAERQEILARYQFVDPNKEVPTDLLEDTLIYFDQNKDKFTNQLFVTIIDFKPRSDKQRFYLVDMTTGAVEKYHVAHGWGSDPNKDGSATKFGNVVNSGKSSLGFIRTGEVYWGKFKRSVRLDGLAKTNSKLRDRAIVLHGWDDAHEADVIQGFSWGCPALDWSVKDPIIDKVKEGSLMYMGVSKDK